MKKISITLLCIAAIVVGIKVHTARCRELQQCRADRSALIERLTDSTLRCDSLTIETERLTLSVEELRDKQKHLMRRIRSLEIAPKRVVSVSESAMKTVVEINVPAEPLGDSLRRFEWNDPWTRVSGVVADENVACTVESVDTLLQVIHRVPYRWWFFRWGTKAVRQTVRSSNPHTRIVYSEYIELR